MRRGITFFDVLVGTFVVFLVLLVLLYFPGSQGKAAWRKTAHLSHMKQLTTAAGQYATEHDGRFMLAFGTGAGGAYAWNRGALTPADEDIYIGPVVERRFESRSAWSNSLSPYLDWPANLALPGAPASFRPDLGLSEKTIAPGKTLSIGTTYNGLLHGYRESAIAKRSRLPLFWSGLGKAQIFNLAYSSPTLVCPQNEPAPCSYVPSASGCSSQKNGSTSALMRLQGTPWIYEHSMRDAYGANMAFSDGQARFHSFSRTVGRGITDPDENPFTDYDGRGIPRSYWWDGCHPWLFRPDYDFEEDSR